ncbi:hypothetical protein Bca101_020401 [Brassica carinata]
MTSIDRCPEFGKKVFRYGVRKFFWEQRDEYGVYIDEKGFARGIDGDVIRVSKDDIKKLLQRTSMDERSYICLPEHASSFKRRELVQETYTKDEINKIFTGLLGERKWEKLSMEKSLEDATDKLRSEMKWMFSADQALLKKVKRLELELEDLRNTQNHGQTSSISIDRVTSTSTDMKPTPSNTYSKHEVDVSLGDIWKELKKAEARFSSKLTKTCEPIFHNLGDLSICTEEMKRSIRLINAAHADMNPAAPCNPFGGLTRLKVVERKLADIHFVVDKEVEKLALRMDTMQQEAEKFQRQLDYQAASIASIDELNLTSIDRRLAEIDGQM